ncbi:MAG TPA: SDR family oxidoreductase [Anaerolineae bacterium]|nr:SDR family oxidoreductase [Anaerolineae bacterium]
MKRQTALITGASSGIGRELAPLFAQDGVNLALVARDRERLGSLAADLRAKYGVDVTVIPQDLAQPGAPEVIHQTLQAQGITVDFLVNNAGTQVYGPIQDTDVAQQLSLIQVNLTALTHLTMLLLPEMLQRGSGRILNVASTGGFAPAPFNAIYCATKAYVLNFSEAIARDLEHTGVSVTCLCPGPTRTDFARRADIENIRLFRLSSMNASQVAQAGYAGMLKGKTTVVPGLFNKLLALSIRFTPRRLVTRLGKYLMARAG